MYDVFRAAMRAAMLVGLCALGPFTVSADTGPADAAVAAPRVLEADPSDYLSKLRTLKAGDTLRLAPGDYAGDAGIVGLPVFDRHGRPEAPITITGPETGPPAVILGAARANTVRIANASHIVIRHLTIDGRDQGGDGVNNQGPSHHVTLEHLVIRGVGDDQGTVGISTNRAPAWNWTIRRCTIERAGTGMYLGNSDGANPFVAGVIEHNVVRDTLGYNVQVKHQRPWPAGVPLPQERTTTVIRHNVFVKQSNAAQGKQARPNLLIGDLPPSGPGSDNGYEVYGNVFFQSPGESLLQAEGNVAIYANVLVNDGGSGISIQRHNGQVRDVRIVGNTIIAAGHGIRVAPGEGNAFAQVVSGNAVFAALPIAAPTASSNVTGVVSDAARFLVQPRTAAGPLNLGPRRDALRGPRIDARILAGASEAHLDFDGKGRDWSMRGAYSGPAAPLPLALPATP